MTPGTRLAAAAPHLDVEAIVIFAVMFLAVTVIGFLAVRWKRGDIHLIEEWGLAGRRFGGWVTWFLIGGDIYTAYTFIAVPALVYGKGSPGFFAVAYTIIVFPVLFVVFPRMWAVAKRRGYVTAADFVQGRFASPSLGLVIALTGIVATLPYIALQLIGLKAVLTQMGVPGDLPIILAFVVLAAYTFTSGLRAPALVAVVKDVCIYATVLVAVVYIPLHLGGFGHIFHSAGAALAKHKGAAVVPHTSAAYSSYATLALGSALALFLYPHALVGVFSARSGRVIQRNATALSAYSLVLAFVALFGFMALAVGLKLHNANLAVPALFAKVFPSWFQGFAFGAIGIGALVPAAIMSIAAANLFSRNIYKPFIRRGGISTGEESLVAKIASLVVKAAALAFVVGAPTTYAIDLQLLGGVWILQTLPAVVIGLYTRWFDRRAQIAGWAVGMGLGTWMAVSQSLSSTFPLHVGGFKFAAYAGFFALIANLVVTALGTLMASAVRILPRPDETMAADYLDLGEALRSTA